MGRKSAQAGRQSCIAATMPVGSACVLTGCTRALERQPQISHTVPDPAPTLIGRAPCIPASSLCAYRMSGARAGAGQRWGWRSRRAWATMMAATICAPMTAPNRSFPGAGGDQQSRRVRATNAVTCPETESFRKVMVADRKINATTLLINRSITLMVSAIRQKVRLVMRSNNSGARQTVRMGNAAWCYCRIQRGRAHLVEYVHPQHGSRRCTTHPPPDLHRRPVVSDRPRLTDTPCSRDPPRAHAAHRPPEP